MNPTHPPITFEQAIKLHELNFKCAIISSSSYFDGDPKVKGPATYYPNPTLSELIEACGKYMILVQLEDGWGAAKSPDGFNEIFTLGEHASGNTPSEAVANLWLKLNSK